MPNTAWLIFGVLIILAFLVGLISYFKKNRPQKKDESDRIENGVDYLVIKINRNKNGKKLTVVKAPEGSEALNLSQRQKLTWLAQGKYQSYDFSEGRVFCKINGTIDFKQTRALSF